MFQIVEYKLYGETSIQTKKTDPKVFTNKRVVKRRIMRNVKLFDEVIVETSAKCKPWRSFFHGVKTIDDPDSIGKYF